MQEDLYLDLRQLNCPLPILKTKKALAQMPAGSVLKIVATDAGVPADFTVFCQQTGHTLLSCDTQAGEHTLYIQHK